MSETRIQAALFDMDGTLTKPILDFAAIRAAIGVTSSLPLLEHLDGLGSEDRERGYAILERFETEAADRAEFSPGAPELFDFLRRHGLPTGVVTRNSRRSTLRTLDVLGLTVSVTVCREDAPVKPSPEPALLASRQLGVNPGHCLFVGDYEFDIRSGNDAGMCTVLIPSRPPKPTMPKPDFLVSSLHDVVTIVKRLNGWD